MSVRIAMPKSLTAAATAAVLLAGLTVAVTPASAKPATPAKPARPAPRATPAVPRSAAGHGTATPAPTARHRRVDPSKLRFGALDHSPAARRTVFVQLAGDGAATVSSRVFRTARGSTTARRFEARSAALARRAQIDSTADRVLRATLAADGKAGELFRVGNAVPGLAVTATVGALRRLAARPDVVKISPIVPKKPSNASAAQLTKVLATWQQTGATGAGVTVGVIDTGLDYTHADFGGTGTVAAWTAAHAAPTDAGWRAGLPALAQAKIAGGWDFVGDDYNADPTSPAYQPVAHEDPDPLDCGEHGTHVAGTVAGYGVTAAGATFTGDYATLSGADLDGLKIGPGMAPKAQLYALKVFGCDGSTDLVIPALDKALDPNGDGNFADHLDIVNLSLGSDYVPVDDPENDVINALAAQGVLPVIAMGNNGDLTDTGGAPGNAVRSLAVASSVDALQLRDGLRINAPTGVVANDIASGQNSSSFPWATHAPVTGDVVAIPGPNKDGCDPFTLVEKAAVKGNVAWLEWDDNDATRRCGSATRAGNAKKAGAVGVILTSTLDVFGAGIAGSADIPVFQLPKAGTDALRPHLDDPLNVTFDGSLAATIADRSDAIVDTVSSFTSRGTHGSLGAVKPDVAAPGDTIASAGMGSGTGVLVLSGTSMATPHAAGIAALVKAAHPAWTTEQVKAAIMNTAGHDLHDDSGHTYGPARVGAGRVDAQAAVDTHILAYAADQPGAVSATFGVVEAPAGVKTLTRTRSVRVENTGATAATLALSYDAVVAQPGVRYSVRPSALTLGAGESATATVTMTVTTAELAHSLDPTMPATQDVGLGAPIPRQYVSDASGRVLIAQAGQPALRVPVYGAAKPAATIRATSATVDSSAGLRLTGAGVAQGGGSTAFASLVSVMDFGASSPRLPACALGAAVDNCTPNESATGGDIQYVGAGSSTFGGSLADGYLWFGVSTYGNSATIGNTTTPYVDFDTTGDGTPDFETFAQNFPGSDVLAAVTVDLRTGDVVDEEPVNFNVGDVDTNTFDSNVLLLPVWPRTIGVSDDVDTFPISYRVGTFSVYGSAANNGDIDDVGPVSFDVVNPAVGVDDPLWLDQGGDTIATATFEPNAAALVLHLHNTTGTRAQKVLLHSPSRLSITKAHAITYGKRTWIKTHLVDLLEGGGVANARLSLYAMTGSGGPWLKVADVRTAADGGAAVRVTPRHTARYQWRFAGDSTHAPATSATTTVSVKLAVSGRATPRVVKRGSTVQIWGTLAPARPGTQVNLRQFVPAQWSLVRQTKISRHRLPDGSVRQGYVFSLRITTPGTYYFRTSVRGAGGLESGYSRTITITVL